MAIARVCKQVLVGSVRCTAPQKGDLRRPDGVVLSLAAVDHRGHLDIGKVLNGTLQP